MNVRYIESIADISRRGWIDFNPEATQLMKGDRQQPFYVGTAMMLPRTQDCVTKAWKTTGEPAVLVGVVSVPKSCFNDEGPDLAFIPVYQALEVSRPLSGYNASPASRLIAAVHAKKAAA